MDDALVGSAMNGDGPAREKVYVLVRDAILRGDYPGGRFIEEEAVCRLAGVSRTPVREAFHRLASERFLDLLPRRGARVRPVTGRDLVEVFETRRLIEGFAIDRICALGAVDVEPVARRAEALRSRAGGDMNVCVELDILLHREIVLAAGNTILVEAYDGLRARQHRVALAILSVVSGRMPKMLEEHDRLVAALRAGDAEAARAVLAEHLQPNDEVPARLA